MLRRLGIGVALGSATVLLVATQAGAAAKTATLSCRPGQIVAVAVTASPPSVRAGTPVTITAQALNCTSTTQSVSEVDTVTSPAPCADDTGPPSPDTFAPNQRVQNTFAWPTSDCRGKWSFTITLYEGSTIVGTGTASWKVRP